MAPPTSARLDLVSSLVVGGFGAFTAILGVWALVDTSSFYDEIATFEPYNRHFLHDVGAFQVGLGSALLFALVWRGDALLAALGGGALGTTAHWIAHVGDEDLGGRTSDPYSLGVIALVFVVVFVWRLWAHQRS